MNANNNERQQASLLLHPSVTTDSFNGDAILHQDAQNASTWKRLHILAAQSGLFMSSLALMSTIGLDYLLFFLYSSSSTVPQQQPPKVNVLFFAATSCVINLLLAIFTLSILHDLARHAYSKSAHQPQPPSQTRSTVSKTDDNEDLQEALYDVDISYILGAVTGTSLLWIMLDLFMGLQRQVLFPVTCLILTFACVRWLHHYNNHDNNHDGVSHSRADSTVYYALLDPASSSKANDDSFPVTIV